MTHAEPLQLERELAAMRAQLGLLLAREEARLALERREVMHAAWVARMRNERASHRLAGPLAALFVGVPLVVGGALLWDEAPTAAMLVSTIGWLTTAGGAWLLGTRVQKRRAISRDIEASERSQEVARPVSVSWGAGAHGGAVHLRGSF
jgi:hypothetical protein